MYKLAKMYVDYKTYIFSSIRAQEANPDADPDRVWEEVLQAQQAMRVDPAQDLNVVQADPADNRYLECAVEGGASYIVAGDKHLLDLKEYEGIVILPPAGFLWLHDST
jgi:predicted nucleic acid-binding protein